MRAVIVCVMVLATVGACGQAYGSTLTLDPIPGWVYVDQVVMFTGTLTNGGYAVSGATVWICEDDPFVPDECLAWGTTNHAGGFVIPWVAKAGWVETEFDIYADFKGNGQYSRDRSPNQYMNVYKLGGSITLDPIPTSAAFGEVIALSGTLVLDGRNPEGAIVYIKDEDMWNPDDLLTSAYVDAAGRFSTYWVVDDVDPNYTIEIQAVFEGDAKWYRQASPIREVTWYVDLPGLGPGPTGGGGYMELYRSLDFERTPLVAIVPSPDSYDDVRKHIIPVQEGILGMVSMLERHSPGGEWDVNFEVVLPGGLFGARPDVIVNLVTRDDESGCLDWWGWALIASPKPVPTWVCSNDSSANDQIGSTAVHEFVHAIGLGHAFNVPGDLMCSYEDGYGWTCPGNTGSKSTTLSELNLDALVAVYGTDGFTNPNNQIFWKERFVLSDELSSSRSGSNESGGEYDPAVLFPIYDRYDSGEVVWLVFYPGGDDRQIGSARLYPYEHGAEYGLVEEDGVLWVYVAGIYTPGVYVFELYDVQSEFIADTMFEIANP